MQPLLRALRPRISCVFINPVPRLLSSPPSIPRIRTMHTSEALDRILAGKYPAKTHAAKVAAALQAADPSISEGIIYLESAKSQLHEDSDQEVEIRQRRPFFYLTGLSLPDSVVTYNLATQQLTIYIPPLDPAEVLWMGLPLSPEEAQRTLDADAVYTTAALPAALAALTSQRIFTLPHFSHLTATHAHVDTALLPAALTTARITKTPYEVALIEQANLTTAAAHEACMRAVRTARSESELHGLFLQVCTSRGSPRQAYGGIFAAGRNAATLHYTHNNAPLTGRQNLLLDAGAELRCYASDVTRTFPISGAFTPESRAVYDIVLRMQQACIAATRPGARWEDVHELAHRVLIEGLLQLGVLRGGTVEEILAARTSCAFLPHGLGHYIGLDTHDVGGEPRGDEPDPLFRYLRKRGTLPVGAVITVEPGLYFCEFIVRPYLRDEKHARFIDAEVLERYWDVGGVRIEDNLLITEDGNRNLTHAVKEVDDMLRLINGEA